MALKGEFQSEENTCKGLEMKKMCLRKGKIVVPAEGVFKEKARMDS